VGVIDKMDFIATALGAILVLPAMLV